MTQDESTAETGRAWLSPAQAPEAALPIPTTERWQPLRLGLVDLFYYDDEQFWFHDGRLLLRGNNGTGKSKVLALTLPFLLDGSILPRRVEPDADPKKRMEWNLLLGGAHGSSERTGYTWIEFGRRDADGSHHFTTLGIGLKAAAGRGIVKTWYFTTTRRIGDLRLLDESRTVLGAERLREAIGTTGAVHATQEAYRRAIDEALFGLGEERYAALIDLLIQLRQPQLSKRPDERALSAALTEALAPLDQAVVADVAESFRSLEEERDAIEESRDTLRAAEDFLKHYRAYARVASRRHTTAVRLGNSKYEHAGRDLREAEEELGRVVAELERLEAARGASEERQGVLEGQAAALRDSPAMREAEGLRLAEKAAADAEDVAQREEADAAVAAATSEREATATRAADGKRDRAESEAAERESAAARSAAAAGLAEQHPAVLADRGEGERVLALAASRSVTCAGSPSRHGRRGGGRRRPVAGWTRPTRLPPPAPKGCAPPRRVSTRPSPAIVPRSSSISPVYGGCGSSRHPSRSPTWPRAGLAACPASRRPAPHSMRRPRSR